MRARLTLLSVLLLASCAQPVYREAAAPAGSTQGSKTDALVARLSPSGQRVWLEWERRPTETDYGSFLVKVGRENRADGSPVLLDVPGTLSVELWMPSMGHGSSPVTVDKLDVGTFRATDVFFTMPGDWEIRLQLREGASVEQVAVPIRI